MIPSPNLEVAQIDWTTLIRVPTALKSAGINQANHDNKASIAAKPNIVKMLGVSSGFSLLLNNTIERTVLIGISARFMQKKYMAIGLSPWAVSHSAVGELAPKVLMRDASV